MLTLFFTIIFIAEVIITSWIISWILKLDKCVLETNEKISQCSSEIKLGITQTKTSLEELKDKLNGFIEFVSTQKENCVNTIKKNLIITTLSVIFRVPMKHIISLIDAALSLKKYIKL